MDAAPDAVPNTTPTAAPGTADVVLAVMPFADAGRPAIGVSLLAAAARRAGYTATVTYANLALAARLGVELFQRVSSGFAPDLAVGEWFFADDVFGDEIPPAADYLQQVLARYATPETLRALWDARALRARYLDEVARAVAARRPRVVGFTTTFHQTCPSVAVARRLKQLPNPPVVVFGGANCEGEMGEQLLASFDCIDYVCRGEAELSFVALLDHLLRGAPPPTAGVLARGQTDAERAAAGGSFAVRDLDALPYPDYADYFAALRAEGLDEAVRVAVVVETSRGCWWGAKHHCTFCGLNGETLAFRSKSPERAYDEILHVARASGVGRVGCVDNILDMRYLDTLFPRLAASGVALDLFYEVKANLRRDQLAKMHAGGMREIQPGIESFSDAVLKLMRKGVTGAQNVQLLRWCREVGIACAWNLLGGFPEEDPAEYARMAELIPLLTHLDPPCSAAQLRLDRFSPFHTAPDAFGFRRVRPARAYFYVFPFARREIERLAYFFDFDYRDGRDPQSYLTAVQQAVDGWWTAARDPAGPPRLEARFADAPEPLVEVVDTRPVARAPRHELVGLTARLLARCDVAATLPALLADAAPGAPAEEVHAALDRLVGDRLVARMGAHFLSLPVFVNRPAPSPAADPTGWTHAPLVAPAAPPEPLLRLV